MLISRTPINGNETVKTETGTVGNLNGDRFTYEEIFLFTNNDVYDGKYFSRSFKKEENISVVCVKI